MTMATFLAVARGEHPADLVLRGARIANVFTLEYEEAEVALWQGRIAGVGKGYRGAVGRISRGWCWRGFSTDTATSRARSSPRGFSELAAVRGTAAVARTPRERQRLRPRRSGVHVARGVGLSGGAFLRGSVLRARVALRDGLRDPGRGGPGDLFRPGVVRLPGRGDELSRGDVGRPGAMEQALRRGVPGEIRPRAGAFRRGALRLLRERLRLGPRERHRRGGAGKTAPGHVAHDPRGGDGAQPGGTGSPRGGGRGPVEPVHAGERRPDGPVSAGPGASGREDPPRRAARHLSPGGAAHGDPLSRLVFRASGPGRGGAGICGGPGGGGRSRILPGAAGVEARAPRGGGRAPRRPCGARRRLPQESPSGSPCRRKRPSPLPCRRVHGSG
jgi:hypothetical protein